MAAITQQGNGVAEQSVEDRLGSLLDNENSEPEAKRQPAPPAEQETEEEADPDAEEADEEESESDVEDEEADPDAEEADEEESESEADPAALTDDVEIDVKGTKVKLGELKRGYFREADYTRKTQALADQRRNVEAETQQLLSERQAAQMALQQASAYIHQAMPQEPNWQQLYMENPQEYAIQREAWRSMKEQQQAFAQQQQVMFEQRHAHEQQQQQQLLQSEMAKLVEAIPDWGKPETAAKERERLVEWGQKAGYTVEELGSITDHRALVVARKAMLYDAMMARKAGLKPQARGPRQVAPGVAVRSTGKHAKQAKDARQRLARSGSVNDAAALMSGFLDGD